MGSPKSPQAPIKGILTNKNFSKSLPDISKHSEVDVPSSNSGSFRSVNGSESSGSLRPSSREFTSNDIESLQYAVKIASAHFAIKPPNFFAVQV